MSGRAGGYVYYWAYGRLCWRVHVIPKDPRTVAQRRSRAAFGAASKTWSASQPLTEAQRRAWYAEAAKIRSSPRLGQSGPLTGQQHFVGRNSVKERWGSTLLLEPGHGGRKNAECRMKKAESGPEVLPAQGLARASSDTRQGCATRAPATPQSAKGCSWKSLGTPAPRLGPCPQRVTRSSSDRPQTASQSLPMQCRWPARHPGCLSKVGLPRWPRTLAHTRRSVRFRALCRPP